MVYFLPLKILRTLISILVKNFEAIWNFREQYTGIMMATSRFWEFIHR